MKNIPKDTKVLMLENIHPKAKELYVHSGIFQEHEVTVRERAFSVEELIEVIKNHPKLRVLCIRSKTHVSSMDILTTIQEYNDQLIISGYCIDPKVDKQNRLPFAPTFNDPFSSINAVKEQTLATVLNSAKGLAAQWDKTKKGMWKKGLMDIQNGSKRFEIRGKKLGVIGFGKIGREVAKAFSGLGVDIYYYDTREEYELLKEMKSLDHKNITVKNMFGTYSDKETIYKTVDIITIHADGREKNVEMIDAETVDMMIGNKNLKVMVNHARGSHWKTKEIRKFALSRPDVNIFLDVLEKEPSQNGKFENPFEDLPNVYITCHIGATTTETQEDIAEFVTNNTLNFLKRGSTIGSNNIPQYDMGKLEKNRIRIFSIHPDQRGERFKLSNILQHGNIKKEHLYTHNNIGFVWIDLEVHGKVDKIIEMLKKGITGHSIFYFEQ